MVHILNNKEMSSEQPVKKKLRREDESETQDETDFIQCPLENGITDLSALQFSLPVSVNEDDITLNTVNEYRKSKSPFRTCNEPPAPAPAPVPAPTATSTACVSNCATSSTNCLLYSQQYHARDDNISIKPAPDILCESRPSNSTSSGSSLPVNMRATNHDRCQLIQLISRHESLDNRDEVFQEVASDEHLDLDIIQSSLIKQCLCGVPEVELRKVFRYVVSGNSTNGALSELSIKEILQFLSYFQLLLDVYLKQNNVGYICSRIVSICESLANEENDLIEEVISLAEVRNKYVSYLVPRVLSSFLIMSKTNVNHEWLERITNFLVTDQIDYVRMNFCLEVIKRVVEWKDIEIHVLEENQPQDVAGSSSQDSQVNVNCVTVPFSDPESFDTSSIKGLVIKELETKWPDLISKVQFLISNNNTIQGQTCVLTFLALWESIISVKANLSVIDTKLFYANLEKFVVLLHNNLSPIIWKQLLSLFNEVLCYGSTLALQDMLPNDICQLAHLLVRYVKDFRLLDCLPYRRNEGHVVNSFVGAIPSTNSNQTNIDKTLLQKMALLVLKSVAITVKETRSDSSDSSVGSDDFDYFQDMQVIERSIRDVLKKLDFFVKGSLEFHPETPFSNILVHLFSDQDDYMIEAMVCTLDITVGISFRHSAYPDLLVMLNPSHSFIEFLKVVSHDSEVLLDYLVSNETCFLLYLLRFLKYTRKNWERFLSSCCENVSRTNELDNVMTVLIRLKMQISRLVARDLFPYNINPVLRLLEICEYLYEGNDSVGS